MRFSSLVTLLLSFSAYHTVVKARALSIQARDDDLPARVPYVFPPPGTNEVYRTVNCIIDLFIALMF